MEKEAEKAKMPHFSNLNEDPALTNKLIHMIKPGNFLISCFFYKFLLDKDPFCWITGTFGRLPQSFKARVGSSSSPAPFRPMMQ